MTSGWGVNEIYASFLSTLRSDSRDELDFPKIHLQPLIVVFMFRTPASYSTLNAIILFVESSVISTEIPSA